MSLVELRKSHQSDAVSGGAMDRVIVRKTLDRRIIIAGAVAAVLLLVLVFWLFAPRSDSMTVAQDRLTISEAQAGTSWARPQAGPHRWTRDSRSPKAGSVLLAAGEGARARGERRRE